LRQAALTAYQAISGEEDDRPGVLDLLGRAVSACLDGGKLDRALAIEGEALNAALAQAEESARSLRDYLESIEADPEVLERTTERLFLIGDLKRKFGESVPEILAYADEARRRLVEIEHRSARHEELLAREKALHTEMMLAAGALSSRRRAAAGQLSAAVEHELADLRLADTRFVVSVEPGNDVDLTGMDRVEFLLAAGTEEALRPMGRIASGGELARLALALKTVLARAETRPTLIFDEIDVGVGGRTGPVVGQKLWAVAGAGHQVLCVTHMPQVAAFADAHFVVANARATLLEDDTQRVEELAAMLAGTVTQASRESARELLSRSRALKGSNRKVKA
jgi:DNA repair protein RecN (Recombination protein N)